MYSNTTFVLLSTGGLTQPEWSPCTIVPIPDVKQVEYFAGSKAVDALVNDSPWCAEKVKEGSEHTFDCRERAIEFMDLMLKHKMFHRARKIPVHSEKKKTK